MALQVLSNQQKEDLKNNQNFKEEVNWALLNNASYWKGLDGTTPPDGVNPAGLARWAKSRQYAAQVLANPAVVSTSNQQIVEKALIYLKTIACVDSAVVDFDLAAQQVVIDYLLANNKFELVANNYFDDVIATTLF